MKPLRFIAVLVATAAAAGLPAAAASAPAPATAPTPTPTPKQSVPNPLAPRFKQVRERIDALFQHRQEPPPPPDPKDNPFRVPGGAAAAVPGADAAGAAAPAPVAPMDNLALLQQAAASLKISGVFEMGGRSHLVINARPYKQGDVIPAMARGERIYLRVREISRGSVTLVLNEAELTLKY